MTDVDSLRRAGGAAKVSALVPDAPSGTVLEAASLAERHGLDQLWVGDPNGRDLPRSDDRYVLTSLAGVAARTRELRLGAFLPKVCRPGALTDAELLHVVEDISIVDQASCGRLELGLLPTVAGWVSHLELVLSLWTDGWPVGDGTLVAVTPPPSQPLLPRAVVGANSASATRLGASCIVRGGERVELGVRGRVILLKELPGSVRAWLVDDPPGELAALRSDVRALGAAEVLFVLTGQRLTEDLEALGSVVGPCLRCATDNVGALAVDAWDWFTHGAAASIEPPEFALASERLTVSGGYVAMRTELAHPYAEKRRRLAERCAVRADVEVEQ
jgi:Luciferase-like monooxygenase